MVKVSISLPNNAQITFESEEAEILRDVVGLVLRDLPRDLMQTVPSGNGQQGAPHSPEETGQKSTNPAAVPVPEPVAATAPAPETPRPASSPRQAQRAPATRTSAPTTASQASANGGNPGFRPQDQSPEDTAAYVSFCQDANPMGDMRRVVAATEGAHRFFRLEGVNADDLGLLFDLAGWRRPGNFTQTLRNAARSKFGWLERIPGRSGRYAATESGRSVISGG